MTPSKQVSETRTEEPLFADVQGGNLNFLVLLRILVALVLFFGGIYLMGLSFSIHDWAIELFMGGMTAVTVAFIMAFTKFTSK